MGAKEAARRCQSPGLEAQGRSGVDSVPKRAGIAPCRPVGASNGVDFITICRPGPLYVASSLPTGTCLAVLSGCQGCQSIF